MAAGGKHEAKSIETQGIWYQRQRWLRTALQTALAVLVTLGGSVALLQAIAPQILAAVVDVLPPAVYAWLAGAFAFIIAIASALSKLMAIPAVNALLTRIGFGSEPKEIAQERAAATSSNLQPARFTASDSDYRADQ